MSLAVRTRPKYFVATEMRLSLQERKHKAKCLPSAIATVRHFEVVLRDVVESPIRILEV